MHSWRLLSQVDKLINAQTYVYLNQTQDRTFIVDLCNSLCFIWIRPYDVIGDLCLFESNHMTSLETCFNWIKLYDVIGDLCLFESNHMTSFGDLFYLNKTMWRYWKPVLLKIKLYDVIGDLFYLNKTMRCLTAALATYATVNVYLNQTSWHHGDLCFIRDLRYILIKENRSFLETTQYDVTDVK